MNHRQKRIQWEDKEVFLHLFLDFTVHHELTLAKERNRYQKMMVASLTHELRTPLNSSTASLQVMDDYITEEEGKRHLRTAISSNRVLAALIQDILDLSRLE